MTPTRMKTPDPATAAGPWITIAGTASARQVEEAARALGVRLDRARRTYWQREHLFPLAATRRGGRGPGRFHPDAAHLAVLVDECLRRRLPHRPEGARSSLVPLRELLAAWWREAIAADDDPATAERGFYGRVASSATLLREGRVPAELCRRDPSPPGPRPGRAAAPREGSDAGAASARESDALSLAVLLEFATAPVHPAKRGTWRMSPDAVRELLAAWPAPSGEADDGERERALGRWVTRLSAAISAGRDPLRLA